MAIQKVYNTSAGVWEAVDSGAINDGTNRYTPNDIKNLYMRNDWVSIREYGAISLEENPTFDSTTAVQNAINTGKNIIFPSGTYLCSSLSIRSNTKWLGLGNAVIKHKMTGGFLSTFDRAMVVNVNVPSYKSPSDSTRTIVTGVDSNITIENIVFDGDSQMVYGIQFVATDHIKVRNCNVINARGGLDLRAVRYGTFKRIYCDNVQENVFGVTDENFKVPTVANNRGISRDLVFENCWAVNSCTSNGQSSTVDMKAFKMADGAYNVTFRDCVAKDNKGFGFDIRISTSEYDMQNISYINCKSINNTTPTNPPYSVSQVVGFNTGQCPSGSVMKNITYDNCVSVGSPNAFKNDSGSQSGYVENVTIMGGYWENTYATNGTINTANTVVSINKQFRNFKIIGATLNGATDSHGIYTYGTGDGLKVIDVTIKGVYIPLRLEHTGGRAVLDTVTMTVTNPSSAKDAKYVYISADDVAISNVMGNLDINQYTSHAVRLVSTKKFSISNLVLENTGAINANNDGVQFDTVGTGTITTSTVKNFTNAIRFSNTSTSIAVIANNFKGCTNKYNSTPSYLLVDYKTDIDVTFGTAQTIAALTTTKLNFSTVIRDATSEWDTTNKKITIKESGTYVMSAHASWGDGNGQTGKETQMFVFVNGTQWTIPIATLCAESIADTDLLGAIVRGFNAGDVVEVYFWHSYSGSISVSPVRFTMNKIA